MKEVNFDGLVSPTHNYSGLAAGNLASTQSSGTISRPREAALQGLEKMRVLADRGIPQAFLPPQLRPSIPALRRLGFNGTDPEVLKNAFSTSPGLFAACSSASSMWTANAATVTPSSDSKDGKVHFTPANLVTNFHRSIEVEETEAVLRAVFRNEKFFTHHEALPATPAFADEGAANHTRLSDVHLFVYGSSSQHQELNPKKFPARQTLEASRAIARLHGIAKDKALFIRQNPDAIDAGVFHNDVISTGNENVFLYHEKAFADQENTIQKISESINGQIYLIPVPESDISLSEAVKTYLFNSQIVSLPDGDMLLLCPLECRENKRVGNFITKSILQAPNPVQEVVFQDLRQSMKNGGGPACLRLRVPLTDEEIETLPPRAFFTKETESFLRDWITEIYPEQLELADLTDFERYQTNQKALSELKRWIGL